MALLDRFAICEGHDLFVSRRDILKKRIITCVIIVVVILAAFLVWQQGRTLTSTHHAWIKVQINPQDIHGEAHTKQRQSQVDTILPKLVSILNEAGLVDVTNASVPFNTAAVGNNDEDRILQFKGQATGKDNTIPLEAIIVVDSEEYETLSVNLSEGYSEEPSARLSELYSELDLAIDPKEGNKYVSKLW